MQTVLLGYMGSGKTTLGKLLGKELNLPFLDLDAYIEAGEERSISEIFEDKGELYFRKKEHFYLLEILSKKTGFVLSTGGGTPCYGNNLDAFLKSKAIIIYLKVPIMELSKRLEKQKASRPLIRHIPDAELPEFIGKHLFERNHFYNQADTTIDCGGKDPDDILKEIIAFLDSNRLGKNADR